MNANPEFFKQFLFVEAPDEVPPDMVDVGGGAGPPDIQDDPPTEDFSTDEGMPDLPDDIGDDPQGSDDGPPDLSDDSEGEDGFTDDGFSDDQDESQNNDENENMGIDDKISAIMNMNLYQRFLTLLNTIGSQTSMVKNNSDILYTISSDSVDINSSLKKLEENIRLYLKNSFVNENYSKNLLFFNKCINLLKLLNDTFENKIRKGIKASK